MTPGYPSEQRALSKTPNDIPHSPTVARGEWEGLLRGQVLAAAWASQTTPPQQGSAEGGLSKLGAEFRCVLVWVPGSVLGGAQRDPAERGSARSCQDLAGALVCMRGIRSFSSAMSFTASFS